MAPNSSTLAWKIPWTEEPGRLQSMRSLWVGHDWSDLAAAAAAVCIYLHLNQSDRLHNYTLFTLKVIHSSFNNVDHCAAVHLNNLVITALIAQSCSTLCSTMDCSPPGSSIRGISQARILKWVAISFSRGLFWLRDGTRLCFISHIGRRILYHWVIWEKHTQILMKLITF